MADANGNIVITVTSDVAAINSLVERLNAGTITLKEYQKAIRDLKASAIVGSQGLMDLKNIQEQVSQQTQTATAKMMSSYFRTGEAIRSATAAAKEFQVTIQQSQAGPYMGGTGSMTPGQALMGIGITPEIAAANVEESNRISAAHAETANVLRQEANAQLLVGNETAKSTNKMLGGFRAALLFRSGLQEVINASQLFGDASGSAQQLINKMSQAAGNSAWVFMGLKGMIGGPQAGAVAAILGLASVAGDAAAQLDKDSVSIDNISAKLRDMIATAQNLSADKFKDIDEEIKKIKEDLEPSVWNTLVATYQAMLRYVGTGVAAGFDKRDMAQAKMDALKKDEAQAKILEKQAADRKTGNELQKLELANQAEALTGVEKEYALEKARHIERINAIYETKGLSAEEAHRYLILEDQLHVLKDQAIARKADAEAAKEAKKQSYSGWKDMMDFAAEANKEMAKAAADRKKMIEAQEKAEIASINNIRAQRAKETTEFLKDQARMQDSIKRMAAGPMEDLIHTLIAVGTHTEDTRTAFKRLAQSVIADIENMISRMLAFMAIQALINVATGGTTNVIGAGLNAIGLKGGTTSRAPNPNISTINSVQQMANSPHIVIQNVVHNTVAADSQKLYVLTQTGKQKYDKRTM